MKAIIATLAALAASASFACTTPATGTMEDYMTLATWTERTGSDSDSSGHRTAELRIALPALDVTGHDCLTWSVELVLPPAAAGVTLRGEGASAKRTGLAAGATASSPLALPTREHWGVVRDERGAFVVQVTNPNDGLLAHRASGSPRWIYPVVFQIGD